MSRVRILVITNWNYSGIFIVVVRDRVERILHRGGYMTANRCNPNPLESFQSNTKAEESQYDDVAGLPRQAFFCGDLAIVMAELPANVACRRK